MPAFTYFVCSLTSTRYLGSKILLLVLFLWYIFIIQLHVLQTIHLSRCFVVDVCVSSLKWLPILFACWSMVLLFRNFKQIQTFSPCTVIIPQRQSPKHLLLNISTYVQRKILFWTNQCRIHARIIFITRWEKCNWATFYNNNLLKWDLKPYSIGLVNTVIKWLLFQFNLGAL